MSTSDKTDRIDLGTSGGFVIRPYKGRLPPPSELSDTQRMSTSPPAPPPPRAVAVPTPVPAPLDPPPPDGAANSLVSIEVASTALAGEIIGGPSLPGLDAVIDEEPPVRRAAAARETVPRARKHSTGFLIFLSLFPLGLLLAVGLSYVGERPEMTRVAESSTHVTTQVVTADEAHAAIFDYMRKMDAWAHNIERQQARREWMTGIVAVVAVIFLLKWLATWRRRRE